ncbi:MAG: hypothetical protein ACFFDP_07760 [Promethearchaeota archaeon]
MGEEIINSIILAEPITIYTTMFTSAIRVHGTIAVKPGVAIMKLGQQRFGLDRRIPHLGTTAYCM